MRYSSLTFWLIRESKLFSDKGEFGIHLLHQRNGTSEQTGLCMVQQEENSMASCKHAIVCISYGEKQQQFK